MTLPPAIREALIKRLRERGDFFGVHSQGAVPLPPLTYERLMEVCAVELLAHLTAGQAEFDELACEDAAIAAGCAKIYAGKPGIHHVDCEYFDEGARWQHAQDIARVQVLRDMNAELNELGCKADAEIAALKAERDLWRNSQMLHDQAAEIERLRAELAEAREDCSNYAKALGEMRGGK